jgi:hypothetical protein
MRRRTILSAFFSAIALGSCIVSASACARPPRTPSPVAPAQALHVVFTSPPCDATGPAPSTEAVLGGVVNFKEEERFWQLQGCFPIRLSKAPLCEWACVLFHGGPCGNAGSHDVVAIVAREHVVGYAAIRDSGAWFERDFHIEDSPRGPLLQVDLHGTPRSAPPRPVAYRLVGERLVRLDGQASDFNRPK